MKRVLFAAALALAMTSAQALAAKPQITGSAAEQGNSIAPRNSGQGAASKTSNGKEAKSRSGKSKKEQKQSAPVTASATPIADPNKTTTTDAPQPKAMTSGVPASGSSSNTPTPANKTSETASTTAVTTAPAVTVQPPTSVYRIGVGDILDIRLLNTPSRESTLYTVLPGGMLEYPLAGDPVKVAGMTTDEIAARLQSLIKLYDKPRMTVNVREYASHTVIVTGLVNDPGMKVLRREAVPLYVVITEAQPRAEAARAIIMRQGSPNVTVDLADTNGMSALVLPGDVIKLAPALPQFYFIGGAVATPGQKNFHSGLTLTQAILAAGGATRFAASEVKVSRQGADGRLVTTKYNLKKIEDGKIPDPVLQAGDRVEVSRGGW